MYTAEIKFSRTSRTSEMLLILLTLSSLFSIFTTAVNNCSTTNIASFFRNSNLVITEANLGHSLSIACPIDLPQKFLWKKDFKLLTAGDENYRFHDNYLEIVKLKLSDLGTYHCLGNVSHGRILSPPIHLKFDELSYPRVSLFEVLDRQTFQIGDTIVLNCSFHYTSSVMTPRIQWFQNDDIIQYMAPCNKPNATKASLCRMGPHSSYLVIYNASSRDEGNYHCLVSLFTLKKNSSSIAVRLENISSQENNVTVLIESFLELHNESSLYSSVHLTAHENKVTTDLICGLPYFKGAVISWTNNCQPAKISKTHPSYTVQLWTKFAFGDYDCPITCAYSKASKHYSPTMAKLTHTIRVYFQVAQLASDITSPRKMIPIGSKIYLSPRWIQMIPTRWFFNGNPIQEMNFIGAIIENGRLTIQNVNSTHEGYYQAISKLTNELLTTILVLPRPLQAMLPTKLSVEKIEQYEELVACFVDIKFDKSLSELPCHIIECGTDVGNINGFRFNPGNNSELKLSLNGVRPYTNYTFFATYALVITWDESMSLMTSGKNVTYLTDEAIPIKCPTFYSINQTATSITIKWHPIPENEQNGQIRFYEIRWQAYIWTQNSYPPFERIALDSDTFEYTLKNLSMSTIYKIFVLVGNNAGSCIDIKSKLFETTSSIIKIDAFQSISKNTSEELYLNMSLSDASKVDQFEIIAKPKDNDTFAITIPACAFENQQNYCLVFTNLVKDSFEFIRVVAKKIKTTETSTPKVASVTETVVHPLPYEYKDDGSVSLNLRCFNNNEEFVLWWRFSRTRKSWLCLRGSYYLTYLQISNEEHIRKNIFIDEHIHSKSWMTKRKLIDPLLMNRAWQLQCIMSPRIYGMTIPQSNYIQGRCDSQIATSPKYIDIELQVGIECFQSKFAYSTLLFTCFFNQTDNFNVSLLTEKIVHSVAIKVTFDEVYNADPYYEIINVAGMELNCSEIWFQFKVISDSMLSNTAVYRMALCPSSNYCLAWSDNMPLIMVEENDNIVAECLVSESNAH